MSFTAYRLRLISLARQMLFLCVFTLACVLGPVAALAQDEIGIYWDDQFTISNSSTPTTPGVVTGYLVLHNPSGTGGVSAWEACIELDGPGALTSFNFQGQAINAGSEPCFAVGYTTPLPMSGTVLLATFDAIALEPGPLYVSIRPAFGASLPNRVSYIAGDDPETLIGMTTVTGTEIVAGLNGANTNLSVNPSALNFGSVALGDSLIQTIRVLNSADTPYVFAHAFDGVCSSFSLPNGAGSVTVPALGFVDIEVLFVPEVLRQVNCDLAIDFLTELIPVTGNGEDPFIDYFVGGSINWGEVLVGGANTQDRKSVV